jgi:lipopolysaccharide transport system permease protein
LNIGTTGEKQSRSCHTIYASRCDLIANSTRSKQVMHSPLDIPVTVIEPAQGWPALDLREIWQYRDLVYFLVWRDVKVRYTQTVLGVTWAVLQPLVTMAIFSVIFGQWANLPSDGIAYPIYALAALVPWQLFSGGLTRASLSLVSDANLLTKVYFPRLIIPLAGVCAVLVDFAISLLVLLGLMFAFGIVPTIAILWLPLLIVFALATALAVSLWLAALNVQYRDVQHMIPFLVQAWMYASPIAYSANLIPSGLARLVYGLNPMAGVIQGFRWALLGTGMPDGMMLVSVTVVLVLLVTGLLYFRRMEESFADVV